MAKKSHTYIGFDSLVEKIHSKGASLKEAKAVAAIQGMKKYGKKAFQAHAASGTSMRKVHPLAK